MAAGYGDPEFVTSTVTAWCYSWIGDDHYECQTLPIADFYNVEARRRFLLPLLAAIETSDVLTCHNLVKFDLKVLLTECARLGLPVLGPTLVQDTMQLTFRPKGFRKGMDNIGVLLKIPTEKLPLNFQQWAEAYGEPDHATIRDRVIGDVRMHKELREAMRARGWLKPPRLWRP